MRQTWTLFKKEVTENNRNFKSFSVLIIFLIIGVISPFLALVTPKLLEKTLSESLGDIEIPDPTAVDSYTQLFSNVNQIGLIVFFIVFGGILTHEIKSGTLINLLTKGLSRSKVITSKLIYLIIIWTISYVLATVITYLYTIYYFDEKIERLLTALSVDWLFGIFLTTLVLLLSVVFKDTTVTLLGMVAVLILMYLIGFLGEVNGLPVSLMSMSTDLLGDEPIEHVKLTTLVNAIWSVINVILSILIFNKREII